MFEPSTPIKIRERRSPSLSLIVVVVLLAIIGFSVYHLVSSHKTNSAVALPQVSATVKATPKPQAQQPAPQSPALRPAVVVRADD